jgi:predicted ArsR family transcriptional regulator
MSSDTQKNILSDLRQHPDVSPAEIAARLSLSPGAVRYHLRQLASQNMIRISGTRQSIRGRGRPDFSYSLDSTQQPDNLSDFAQAVMETLDSLPEEQKGNILLQIGKKLAGQPDRPSANLVTRLQRAILFLNAHNYQAHWEARLDAPYIIFDKCPYHNFSPWCPAICQVDIVMLRTLIETPIRCSHRIQSTIHSDVRCIFRIGE